MNRNRKSITTTALAVVAVVSLLFASLAAAHGSSKYPAAQLALGKKLFKANCGTCHTLKAAGTNGGTGPDLTHLHLSMSKLTTQISGGGGFMPAFAQSKGGQFSPAQLTAVAAYVYTAEGGK